MRFVSILSVLTLLATPAAAITFDCGFFQLCMGEDENTCQDAGYKVTVEAATTATPMMTTVDESYAVQSRQQMDAETWMYAGTRADGGIESLQLHASGKALFVQEVSMDGVTGSTLRHGICTVVQ
ncbi:hypothetical protein [Algirhabdus cladophorae]|uniref:hypothetical protein n=1 Tax=Algirhabdus cladophorae TaxID=3377108 RepID=UPI003B84AEFC